MPPISYFNMILVRDKAFRYGVRRQMVLAALESGHRPTARAYGTSVQTVRKWVRRYQEKGLEGLKERSRAPHRIPHKTSAGAEKQVVALKRKLKGYGVRRMVREFELPVGASAAYRICRQEGLTRRRKKKRQRWNDLRAIKARYRVGEVCGIDTKELVDIPAYWTQMSRLKLPRWQYTWRDFKSGLMFLGYAPDKSLSHATVFAEAVYDWLRFNGVDLKGGHCRSDAGPEFIGSWKSKKKSSFIKALEACGLRHFTAPSMNYNADVETVHNTIELEFFDIESFYNRRDFMSKVSTYQCWYNMIRQISTKNYRSPLEIIRESAPHINQRIASWPALDLDALLVKKWRSQNKTQVGNDVPKHAPVAKFSS